jgi:hypothetical protein
LLKLEPALNINYFMKIFTYIKNMKKYIPLKMKHKISGIINEIYSKKIYLKRKISRKYYKFNLTKEMQDYLSIIDEKGFCTIKRPEFIEVADNINRMNNEIQFENSLSKLHKFLIPGVSNAAGITNHWCSFKNQIIQKIFFDKEILSMLMAYAGTQLKYRQSPILESHLYNGSNLLDLNRKEWANLLHSDYHLQLNIMLLLTDISEETTRTIYAEGSNNRNFLIQRGKIDYPESELLVKNNNYKVVSLLGKRGDLIIMDTGGLHAAEIVAGSNRTMLIGIMNTGFPFKQYHENLNGLNILNGEYNFIKNTICANKKING